MLAKKHFRPLQRVPCGRTPCPPRNSDSLHSRVNHSQNPQIKEVIMSIIKKLVASFVGLNPAGPRSAMETPLGAAGFHSGRDPLGQPGGCC